MSDQPRHPAGIPTGGQFTAAARAEGAVTLASPTIDALHLAPGDSHLLTPAESGSDILDSVEIVRQDDGTYRVDGALGLDFLDAYREVHSVDDSVDLTFGTAAHDTATQWLNDHGSVLEAFVTERYDADLDAGCDDWEHQRLTFSVPLDPETDTVETVAAKLEDQSRAVQAYNESDRGTFGSPYLWGEARRFLDVWDAQVQDAQRGYVADVMEDTGVEYEHAANRTAGMTRDSLDAAAPTVRRFIREQYDTITQARRVHQDRHGTEYSAEHLGRDISLALNNPPGTPHGRLAFAALPFELRDRLQDLARRYAPK